MYKGSSVYEADGAFEVADEGKLIYKRKYPNDIWDKKNEETPNLYFFLRTPAEYIDAKTTGITYYPTQTTVDGKTYAAGSISFSYTSPATASDQKDMLFTSRPLTTADDFTLFTTADQGLPVLFHHALTGVKFAIAADVKETVTITGVEFTGLANSGSCVITPRKENNSYVDDPDDYSSGGTNKTTSWTLGEGTGTFSQEFSGVVSYESAGEEVAHFGDSFYLAGNNNNLNDENASETFWFIPQAMTDNVKLKIYYKVGTGSGQDWTIDFGTTLKNKNVTWQAGELHTYTIRIDDVNVKIEDQVTTQNPTSQYTGSYKDNVVITNTGNTDTYIRAAIIGQWLNSEGNPVFGFTDFTAHTQDEQYVLVDSWYQDQFSASGQHKHGAFKDLVGYKNDTESGTPGAEVFTSDWWIKGGDGYYYFKYVVPAGKAVPAQDSDTKYIVVSSSGTSELTGGAPLFDSYTIKDAPDARVAGKVEEIFFELEIATQAVSAKKTDGSYYTLAEAWAKAGITVTE